jgi:hypothetical protein
MESFSRLRKLRRGSPSSSSSLPTSPTSSCGARLVFEADFWRLATWRMGFVGQAVLESGVRPGPASTEIPLRRATR